MMQIKTADYIIFYEVLRDEYFKNECKGVSDAEINSNTIWNKGVVENGVELKEKLTSRLFALTDTQYFYRKYKEAKRLPPTNLPIRDLALFRGLDYLRSNNRINHPQIKTGSYEEKSTKLLAKLLEDAPLEDNILTTTNSTEQPKSSSPKKNRFSDSDDGFRKIEFLIKEFFRYINERKYYDAWNLLTPKYQFKGPWRGNYYKFISSFTLSDYIFDVLVFDFSLGQNSIRFRVFYKEKTNQIEIDFDYLKSLLELKSLKEFSEHCSIESLKNVDLNRFKNLLGSLYQKKLESSKKTPFGYKWVDSVEIEHIFFESVIDRNLFVELFPSSLTQRVSQTSGGSCSFFEGKWLIEELTGIHTLSHSI